MDNYRDKWQILKTFDSEIESLEFVSPVRGWMSDFIPKDKNDLPTGKLWAKYKQSINRIQITEDGGKTWKILYQESSGLIRHLQYMKETGWLLGIKVIACEGQEHPLHFMLYRSKNKGYHWEKVGDLPYSTKGFYFFDEHQGYAWTLGQIFATSNAGNYWQPIASMDIIYKKGRISNIGNNQFIYFIENEVVVKLNSWKNSRVVLPLPENFKPQDILANPSQAIVYVIGLQNNKWCLLAYKNDKFISTEALPIQEKEFDVEVFAYGKDLLNLVGSTASSFLKPYYFYVRDKNGWHKESLSGSKNFEQFAYWENHAWAVRIALLQGKRELLRRDMIASRRMS